jgi:uncharacterized membrane protein
MASKSRSSRTRKASSTRSSPTMRSGTAARGSGTAARGSGTAARGSATTRGGSAPASARVGTATAKRSEAPQRSTDPAAVGTGTTGASGGKSSAGRPPAWLQWITFLLAVAGLGVSAYLTYAHYNEAALLGCSESGLVNCQKVTTSAQSFVFGIPVAVLGLAFYAFAVPVMSPWAWRLGRRDNGVARWATENLAAIRLASIFIGVGFVLYLLYAELFMIGSICLYCTSVHVITFILFVLVVFAAAAWGLRPSTTEAVD